MENTYAISDEYLCKSTLTLIRLKAIKFNSEKFYLEATLSKSENTLDVQWNEKASV